MKKTLLTLFISINTLLLFGQSGNALYFDNVDDVVTVPNASALIANSDSISMSLWVYPQNTTSVYPDLDGFVGFRNNTDADFYLVQLNSTDVEPRLRNSSGANFDFVFTGLQLNTWQHFVMTYDGINLKIYHNGVFGGMVAANGVITLLNQTFYIGQTPWTSAPFFLNGKLDEVSLWNKTLSQAEIDCIYNGAIDPASPGLELYYRFNQGVAGGANPTVNTLKNATGGTNGNLTGFALNGATSNWITGVATPNSSAIADLICPGATYIFGSQVLTAPGNYYEVFPTSGGCDSIAEVTLTSPVFNLTISQSGPSLTSLQTGAQYQWINCSGNTPIPGANGQNYVATANGQYAVIITLGGCSDTTVCATVTNVGLNDLQSAGISASPNPFIENVNLIFPLTCINKQIVIYDITGRELFKSLITGEKMEIPSSSWISAVYYVSIEGYSSPLKLIKQ